MSRADTRRALTGLYVHIPYCSIKCYYCDFTAFSGQESSKGRYLSAIKREAALYGDSPRPETLYVGGGTPTELTAQELSILLGDLSAAFGPIADMREAQLEANPESTDAEKLAVLSRGGIRRVSFGLQTADDGLLRSVGRRHTFEDFRRVFSAARLEGLSVNVDLMAGLPGQSLALFRRDLDRVLALAPDHLSLYTLAVEDKTQFSKRKIVADDGLGRAMMEHAVEALAAEGFRHYEISNFARPGQESLHNVNYWLDGDYIGLGCGAAGYLDGERWQNEERLAKYMSLVEAGRRPLAGSERLTGKEKLGERMLLRLRLIDGFSLTADMQTVFRPELERLLARGLVELAPAEGERLGCSNCLPVLRLSPEGRFLANEAFREFVAPFS